MLTRPIATLIAGLSLLAVVPALVSCKTSTSSSQASLADGTTPTPKIQYAPPGEHNADDYADEPEPGPLKLDPNSEVGKRVGQFQEVPASAVPNFRYLVVKNHKFGYMDLDGNVAIPCQFDAAENFKEGLALVKSKGKWGYIDHTGAFVIAAKYDQAASFKDGRAEVTFGTEYGYIDSKGAWVSGPYTKAKFLTEGTATSE